MLRITPRESAAAVKAYLTERARLDYYSDGQEILGQFIGEGAKQLGIEGMLDPDVFCRLCDNLHPFENHSFTPRQNANRTCGYDFNFNAPKDVSLVYMWNQDDRIMEAILKAERETMADIETQMRTRVRKDGVSDGDRLTGNLMAAEFVHLTARPSNESAIPDPHVHTHVFVPNITFDPVEKRWKAGQFREIMRNAPHFDALFHTRLANYLIEAGYKIRPEGVSFSIEGVPDELVELFSKRTREIEGWAKKHGVTNPSELDKLGAVTRQKKNSELTFSELRRAWRIQTPESLRQQMDAFLQLPSLQRTATERQVQKVTDTGPRAVTVKDLLGTRSAMPTFAPERDAAVVQFNRKKSRRLPAVRTAMELAALSKPMPEQKTVGLNTSVLNAALDRSIKHNFHRVSVVTEANVLIHAMRYAYGSGMKPEDLEAAMRQNPELIFHETEGQKLVTTRTVLAEEQAMVAWVKKGMGTLQPLSPNHAIKDESLTDEQRAAVVHAVTSRDRFVSIEGKAGTGKTQLLAECARLIREEAVPFLVVAPNTKAVQETIRKRGFPGAQTLEQLLINEKLQQEHRNGVIWVDESSQVSVPSMNRLLAVADKMNARIVTSGDQNQHHGIVRGDAMRSLYQFADLKPAMVTKIQRQQGQYREAIELLSEGRVREGFEVMDGLGWIHEMPFEKRYKAIAELYVKSADEGMRPFVIAPTHAEGRLVTQQIRELRKANGELKDERAIPVLRAVDMTPAERADWRTYRPGWVIEVIRATDASPAGTRMPIEKIDPENGAVYVRKDGAIRYWDLEYYVDHFAVYRPETEWLAVGDRIEITKNGKPEYGTEKVYNGAIHTLAGFVEFGDIKLENGQVLKKDYGHLRYGYSSTSIAAQSTTVNHVIVAESEMSFAAGSRQQFYNSMARGRKRVDTFTNSKVDLLEAVTRSDERRSAMELVTLSQTQSVGEVQTLGLHDAQVASASHKASRSREALGTQTQSKGLADMIPKSPAKKPSLRDQLGRRNQVPEIEPEQVEKIRKHLPDHTPRMLP